MYMCITPTFLGDIYDGDPPNKEMVLIVFYVSFDGWDLAI